MILMISSFYIMFTILLVQSLYMINSIIFFLFLCSFACNRSLDTSIVSVHPAEDQSIIHSDISA